MRQSTLEINTKNFKYNVEQIKKYVGESKILIPVIKASGYGTYINKRLELIKDFEIVAVAIVDEAVELRNIGYKGEIIVLNQPCVEEINSIIENNITVGSSNMDFINEIGKTNKEVKIHIELETGMGRTGIFLKNLQEDINIIKQYKNIIVDGVYTHLSVADYDEDFTNKQIDLFTKGAKIVKENFENIKYIHCQASNGLLNYKVDICNACRPGIILYGYEASNTTFDKIHLRPVAKLKSKISFLKEVEKGQSISYGRTFIADNNMKIATIGLGYADGIRRELSNKGSVVINGRKARIVGKVCMDSFMVDVTNIDCKLEDDVYIWDNKNVTLDEIAKECNTINYEIISTISSRVIRKFE